MAHDETCVAMSDAIRSNATLQGVTFPASYGYMVMDNETGVAMAHAIRGNATLDAFNFYAGDNVNMDRQHETSPGAGARRPVPRTAIVASPRTRAARSCASRTVGVGRTGPRHTPSQLNAKRYTYHLRGAREDSGDSVSVQSDPRLSET